MKSDSSLHDNDFPGNPKYESVLPPDVYLELMRPKNPPPPPPPPKKEPDWRFLILGCILIVSVVVLFGTWGFLIVRETNRHHLTQAEIQQSDEYDYREAQLEHD